MSESAFAPRKKESSPEVQEAADAVRALEQPLTQILNTLRVQIESGEYAAIIGEDASGRIPALVLGKTIDAIYEKANRGKPILRFVAGSRYLHGWEGEEKQTSLEHQVDRIMQESGMTDEGGFGDNPTLKKILLVTDIIESGQSVVPLINAVHANGLKVDVAAVSLITKTGKFEGLPLMPGELLAFGGEHKPLIFGNDASGVWKRPEDLFARRDWDDRVRPLVAEARAEGKKLAERLAESFSAVT
jgi:hypothetical protein